MAEPTPISPADILILPASRADLLSASECNRAAFGEAGPVARFLSPSSLQDPDDPDHAKSNLKRALRWGIQRFDGTGPEDYLFLKAVRKGEEDVVLGYALWERPGYKQPMLREGEVDEEAYSNVSIQNYNELARVAHAKREEVMGDQAWNSWCVKTLAVRPTHQRLAIASRLLSYVLSGPDDVSSPSSFESADSAGLSASVISSPAGQPLYEKLGFRMDKGKVVERLEGLEMENQSIPFMVRWGKGMAREKEDERGL